LSSSAALSKNQGALFLGRVCNYLRNCKSHLIEIRRRQSPVTNGSYHMQLFGYYFARIGSAPNLKTLAVGYVNFICAR